ncbi:MAG: type IV secretion system DNA-binding domain-containing protein [Rhodospirillaceae bacterium]|nr:type IV secretion system DNA-binding domain-containing protein [Rhodospirillaceae bacterium]MYH38608.1 type IV secretion system DNA-binding domain-containing protein [Rhodospirillaceae bacterium]
MMALRTPAGGGWRRPIRVALAVGAIGAVAVPGVRLWQETTAHQWRLLGLGTLARARLAAGAESYTLQRYEWTAGEIASLPLAAIAADPEIDRTRGRLLGAAGEAGWRGLGAGSAAALAALVLLAGLRPYIYGSAGPPQSAQMRAPARRTRADLQRIAAGLRTALPRRAVRIGGIPCPKEARQGHTLVVGAAGSGRTVLIADLVAQRRAQGGRCIVLDRSGACTRLLFDPARDVLLNPLDRRAAAWSPLRDGRGRSDFAAMAAALVPEPADAGQAAAVLAARQLFAETAEALRPRIDIGRDDAGNRALLDLLLDPAPATLAGVLAGTPAWTALARAGPKVLPWAGAILRHYLAALRFAQGEPFSIRDWVDHGDGLLFLASPDDPNGRLRGLVSALLETALRATLSLDPGGGRGLRVVVDGPEALHRLPSLLPALGAARGLGVQIVVGVEALGPLRARYGADGTATVSGLCATRVAMAAADDATAQWSSAAIGSESLAPAWRLRRLAPGRGVLRFPGRRDAVEFALDEPRARGRAARFAPVDGAWMFLDATPGPAPAARTAPTARKAPAQTGGPAKRTSKPARPLETAGTGNARPADGERPEFRRAGERKRRRAGRWI